MSIRPSKQFLTHLVGPDGCMAGGLEEERISVDKINRLDVLILSFRRVLCAVCFLLGISPASEF